MKLTIKHPVNILIFFICGSLLFIQGCQKDINPDILKLNSTTTSNITAKSTIVYTNVNPDSTIVGYSLVGGSALIQKNYNLDLNNDGKADFVLWTYYSRARGCAEGTIINDVTVIPASGSGNQIAANVNQYALALDSLTTIDASLSKWSGATGQELGQLNYICNVCTGAGCSGLPTGPWVTGTTKYLGLKLTIGSNIYYGWARLMIVSYSLLKLTVMDYAYNSAPNQPILAGQTK